MKTIADDELRSYDPLMHHELHTLKNGLRVIFAPMKDTETATVIVMTGTGSRYETEKENGLAHFLEHMFFKGTKKRPSARAISEELDGVGSVYNAFTAKERTAYYAKVRAQDIEKALDVVSDIFLNSTLPAQEITKERGAIIQEIDMYEDMPMRTVDDVFDTLFFGRDHPLGRTILGPKVNIRSFTRKNFASYLSRQYVARNTVVCVTGSFDSKKLLQLIERDFSALPSGEPASCEMFTFSQTTARVAVKSKKTDQTHVIVGVRGYPYGHKDEYALAILATILGGGMSSRLFLEVREKRGLAYSVHAWTEKYPDIGYLAVQAGVEHGKLEKTIDTILAEFKKIKRVSVSVEELEKAKSYRKGTMTLGLETSDAIAENMATSLINVGRVRTLDEVHCGIDAVTIQDVQRVARDIFVTSALNVAVIGPHKEEKLVGLLRL